MYSYKSDNMNMFNKLTIAFMMVGFVTSNELFQSLLIPNIQMTQEMLSQAQPIQDDSFGTCDSLNLNHCLTQYYAQIGLIPPITSPAALYAAIQNLLLVKHTKGLIQACTAETSLYQCLIAKGYYQPSACLSIAQFVSMGISLSDSYQYYAFRKQQQFICGGGEMVYLQNLNCALLTTILHNATLADCLSTYRNQIARHPATICTIAAPQYMNCYKDAFSPCSTAAGWEACEIVRIGLNSGLPSCPLRCTVGTSQLDDYKTNTETEFGKAIQSSVQSKNGDK